MKLIPTFTDCHFIGYKSIKEITNLREIWHREAYEKQKKSQADHMLYCHYDLEGEEIWVAWLYSGIPMTDTEFDRIQNMKHVFIGAIHKHK